jgi:hypothetical protein
MSPFWPVPLVRLAWDYLVSLSWDCGNFLGHSETCSWGICDVSCRRRDRIRDDIVRHGGVVERRRFELK